MHSLYRNGASRYDISRHELQKNLDVAGGRLRLLLTAFCGGLGWSSPGLFLPKQATLHASLTSELNTVKTSITDKPWQRERDGGRTQIKPVF